VPRITEQKRQEIRDLHGQGLSRNEIARRAGVSNESVSKICAAAGLTFDRTATETATKAKQVDTKKVRALLAADSITTARKALDRINVMLDDEEAEFAIRDLGTVVGILADKHMALERMDSSEKDLPAVDKWLAYMMGGTPDD
jgi:predicted transcriptional regulator